MSIFPISGLKVLFYGVPTFIAGLKTPDMGGFSTQLMPFPFHGIELRWIGWEKIQNNGILLGQIVFDRLRLMPSGIIDVEPDSRMRWVTIHEPLHKGYEAFCIAFRDFLNNGIHGAYVYDTTKVNAFTATFREQLRLASFGCPLSRNGRIQLNARFVWKKNRFIRS